MLSSSHGGPARVLGTRIPLEGEAAMSAVSTSFYRGNPPKVMVLGSWLRISTTIRLRPARKEELRRVSKFQPSLTVLVVPRSVSFSCSGQDRHLVYSPLEPTALGLLLGGVLDAVLSLQVGGWAVLASRQCRSSSHSGNKIASSMKTGIQSSLGASYSVIMIFTPLPPLTSRIMPCHQRD